MLKNRCNANKLEAKKMAMAASEIDQVITPIDRSRNEVSTVLEESIEANSRMLREEIDTLEEANSNLFKVIVFITGFIQVEILAVAWWVVSH